MSLALIFVRRGQPGLFITVCLGEHSHEYWSWLSPALKKCA